MTKHQDINALVGDIRVRLESANKSDLARKTGISLSTIKRIANGTYSPRVETLQALVEHFRGQA